MNNIFEKLNQQDRIEMKSEKNFINVDCTTICLVGVLMIVVAVLSTSSIISFAFLIVGIYNIIKGINLYINKIKELNIKYLARLEIKPVK